MKNVGLIAVATLGIGIIGAVTSCDWTGGSDSDFNTSGGASTVNISGFYEGNLSGGKAVGAITGAAKTSLTIQQSGNTVEVIDSNGVQYRGKIGSPAFLIPPGAAISEGQTLATFQIAWSGLDPSNGREIEFTGTLNLTSVASIDGRETIVSTSKNNATASTSGRNSSQGAGTTNNVAATNGAGSTNSVNGTVMSESDSVNLVNGIIANNSTERTTTTSSGGVDSANGSSGGGSINTDSNAQTTNGVNGSGSGTETITQTTFFISDGQARSRLRGTWVEVGGGAGSVDAFATGVNSFSINAAPITTLNTQVVQAPTPTTGIN